MLSRLREHLGTAGLLVAVVALVVALAGGAIAATGGSEGGKATASAKAKKGPRGPKGVKGDKGDTGPAGPAGPQGAKGDTGAPGAAGVAGPKGDTGATGATGKDGLNGKPGKDGETGFTEFLPSEMTETGTWSIETSAAVVTVSPISFPIPLSAADAAAITVHYWRESDVTHDPKCPGTIKEPDAEPGTLCMYIAEKFDSDTIGGNPPIKYADGSGNPGVGDPGGVSTHGAVIYYEELNAGKSQYGTFAVTAP